MKKCRFKVGDLIIGNNINSYGITNRRRIVKVIRVDKGQYKDHEIHNNLEDDMLVELTGKDLQDYSEHVYSVSSKAFKYTERYQKLIEIAKVIK